MMAYDGLIIDLVDELLWDVNTVHRDLAVKALKAIGMSDETIKLYFAREAILDAAQPGTPVERPTTISAGEYMSNGIEYRENECSIFDGEQQITRGFYFVGNDIRLEWGVTGEKIVARDYPLTVRWLDTAQTERDKAAYAEFEAGYQAAEAMDNHDLKMWALSNVNNPAALAAIDRLVAGSYDLQVSADANGWYDGKMEALKEIEALQAERDELARKLAAAGAESQRLRGVVSDLQHDLSVAKDRIAVLEQSEQMLLKRIKKLRSKSELDDGFIDHLTANNEDTQ